MSFKAIVSQVHIPEFDVQGNLTWLQKKDLVLLSIRHLRAWNPDAYIVLTGHGMAPHRETLQYCDWHYWDEKMYPIDSSGYPENMPAQFPFVYKGLRHVQQIGFDYVLKTRGDCLIGVPNITSFCMQTILAEKTQFLITQQSGNEYIGDCFMFGNTAKMCDIWHEKNPIKHRGGLMNTAYHFGRVHQKLDFDNWLSFVREHASFVDIPDINFTCLRWNYHQLAKNWQKTCHDALTNHLDWDQYHWGRANGWHIWEEGKLVQHLSHFWTKDQFYD